MQFRLKHLSQCFQRTLAKIILFSTVRFLRCWCAGLVDDLKLLLDLFTTTPQSFTHRFRCLSKFFRKRFAIPTLFIVKMELLPIRFRDIGFLLCQLQRLSDKSLVQPFRPVAFVSFFCSENRPVVVRDLGPNRPAQISPKTTMFFTIKSFRSSNHGFDCRQSRGLSLCFVFQNLSADT